MDERITGLENPRSTDKALTGPLGGFWRCRVGDCRVICDIQDSTLRVLVVRSGTGAKFTDREILETPQQVTQQTTRPLQPARGSLLRALAAHAHMHLDAIDMSHAKMEGVFRDDTRCGDPDGLAKIDQR